MLNLVFSLHVTPLIHFRSCWISKFNLCIRFYFISWVNLIQHDRLIIKSHLACVIHIAMSPTRFSSSTFLVFKFSGSQSHHKHRIVLFLSYTTCNHVSHPPERLIKHGSLKNKAQQASTLSFSGRASLIILKGPNS